LYTLKALKIMIFLVGRLSGLGGWPANPFMARDAFLKMAEAFKEENK
jgi:hypothetical protein